MKDYVKYLQSVGCTEAEIAAALKLAEQITQGRAKGKLKKRKS